MNNRHLYRGKWLDNGEWVYGGLLKHYARQLSPMGDSYKDGDIVYLILRSGFADWNMPRPIDAMPIDSATVGQSTGVFATKSYRGESEEDRLVFEGDICRNLDGIFLVVWNDEKCAFIMQFYDYPQESLGMEEMRDDTKIIGNIWDNPELVEV